VAQGVPPAFGYTGQISKPRHIIQHGSPDVPHQQEVKWAHLPATSSL